MIGAQLEAVLTRAFSVAKRVRTETEIGQSAVSISYAAVELAREIFGSLNRRRKIMIIGAEECRKPRHGTCSSAGATDILMSESHALNAPNKSRRILTAVRCIPYEQDVKSAS